MRNLLISLALCLCVGITGCKKPKPSEDYADAQQKFAAIYGQKLDDAYADPQMDGIMAELDRVPSDSLDAQAASDLKKRIVDGRAQLAKDRAAREQAAKDATKPMVMPSGMGTGTTVAQPQNVAPTQQPVPDAGPNVAMAPRPGMSMADFEKAWGDCFDYGPTVYLGSAPADSRTQKDLNRCKDKLPGFDSRMLLFQNGVLVNIVDKSALRSETVGADGGMVDAGG